jgi:DNA-binding NarL/FixJ family response regulator
MIRLLIVEDHPAIAEGLAALIGAEPDIEIVGTANDPGTAESLIASLGPDVVLCDIMLSGRDAGFDLLSRHRIVTRFLMYSAFDYQAHHARAVRLGASGYLPKTTDASTIVRTIRRIREGHTAFPAPVLESARGAPRPPTLRELELLRLLVDGASNDDIAAALGIRVKTVEGTIRRLFDRYDRSNRTQLARYALDQGWLTSGPRQRVSP